MLAFSSAPREAKLSKLSSLTGRTLETRAFFGTDVFFTREASVFLIAGFCLGVGPLVMVAAGLKVEV